MRKPEALIHSHNDNYFNAQLWVVLNYNQYFLQLAPLGSTDLNLKDEVSKASEKKIRVDQWSCHCLSIC